MATDVVIHYTHKGAVISADGRYRYRLWREWRDPETHDRRRWRWTNYETDHEYGEPRSCLFVMLNPSTADGSEDDPTIRRCVSFARRERYERLEVVNLFAYRATDPNDLLALIHDDDPVGWENQRHVSLAAADAGLIVAAWGTKGPHLGQDQTMLGWLLPHKVWCLGRTKEGHPKHPLYVMGDAKLEPFDGTRRR